MHNVSLCCIIILIRGDFCENLFMKADLKVLPIRPFSGQGRFWLLQALCISRSFCCSRKLSQGQIWHFQVQISELLYLRSPFQVLLCGCVFERQQHAVPKHYDKIKQHERGVYGQGGKHIRHAGCDRGVGILPLLDIARHALREEVHRHF